MEIRSLEGTHFDSLHRAFSLAFKDYEVQLNKIQLIKMLKRRGFNPNLSFAYFEKGEIVSFILNGIGTYNGILTAYDTGTGTIEDFRGKGLASSLFDYSLPYLRNENIQQYLLEVLQQNFNAFSLYQNMGFVISREFYYYIQNKNKFLINNSLALNDSIRFIDVNQLENLSSFWDSHPSWQNGIEAICRDQDNFEIIASCDNKIIRGYCIYEPESGDIVQIAVDKRYRRKNIATNLINTAFSNIISDTIKVINTDTSCTTISGFLSSIGAEFSGKQYEMLKQL